MRPSRRRAVRPPGRAAPLVAGVALGLLSLAAPALAAAAPSAAPARPAGVVDVRLTQGGPVPARLVVVPGDVVRFVNTDDFPHRVVGDPPGWGFDSGSLLPGRSYEVAPALRGPGRYAYRGVDLESWVGTVVVPGSEGAAAAAQSPAAPVSPSPAAPVRPSPSASPSAASPSASPPPVDGDAPGTVGQGSADPGTALPAGRGLSSPVPARRLGLPIAVSVVLLVTAGSLLVRVLGAEAARGPQRPGAG